MRKITAIKPGVTKINQRPEKEMLKLRHSSTNQGKQALSLLRIKYNLHTSTTNPY